MQDLWQLATTWSETAGAQVAAWASWLAGWLGDQAGFLAPWLDQARAWWDGSLWPVIEHGLRELYATLGDLGLAWLAAGLLIASGLLLRWRRRAGLRRAPLAAAEIEAPGFEADPVVLELIESLRRRRDGLAGGQAAERAAARNAVERAVALEEQNRQLSKLVVDLVRLKLRRPESAAAVDAALADLRAGNIEAVEAVFAGILGRSLRRGPPGNAAEDAAAARHLGALTFLNDSQRAVAAYRRAVDLEPSNPDGWNQLGTLLLQTGDLDGAYAACQTVMALGHPAADQAVMAVAIGNLGLIFRRRGDLERAEEQFRISLAFHAATGRREGMARQYLNLGQVSQTRGELERAEGFYQKALKVDEGLGRFEGMAGAYGNLGMVRKLRGDIPGACSHWSRARDLYATMGMPHMVRLVEDMVSAATARAEKSGT